MELSGKVVIVTGAAGNLGSACARECARQGAKVVATDLPITDIEAVVSDIESRGGEAMAHHADQSLEADVAALVARAEERWGHIDVLVNVAAASRQRELDKDLEVMTVENWDRVIGVNLRGAMLCSKYAIRSMCARGSGAIINFGSTAAILGDEGLIAYSTSKAALLGFTRAIATTYGKQGIRCNAICPGSVWGDPKRERQGMEAEWLDLIERTRNTPRLGVPDDIAHVVVFLASDKASYITGQTFVVDGGGTTHQPWVRVR